jgi:hypothetical protein
VGGSDAVGAHGQVRRAITQQHTAPAMGQPRSPRRNRGQVGRKALPRQLPLGHSAPTTPDWSQEYVTQPVVTDKGEQLGFIALAEAIRPHRKRTEMPLKGVIVSMIFRSTATALKAGTTAPVPRGYPLVFRRRARPKSMFWRVMYSSTASLRRSGELFASAVGLATLVVHRIASPAPDCQEKRRDDCVRFRTQTYPCGAITAYATVRCRTLYTSCERTDSCSQLSRPWPAASLT